MPRPKDQRVVEQVSIAVRRRFQLLDEGGKLHDLIRRDLRVLRSLRRECCPDVSTEGANATIQGCRGT